MWDPRTGHKEQGDAAEVLAAHGLAPLQLGAKEGLALINGTLRDIEGMTCHACGRPGHNESNCPEKDVQSYRADVALVTCKICGDGGHPTFDCPLKGKGAEGAAAAEKMSSEYRSFLSELGVDKVPGVGAPPAAPASRPGLGSAGREREVDPRKIYVGSLPDRVDDGALGRRRDRQPERPAPVALERRERFMRFNVVEDATVKGR